MVNLKQIRLPKKGITLKYDISSYNSTFVGRDKFSTLFPKEGEKLRGIKSKERQIQDSYYGSKFP